MGDDSFDINFKLLAPELQMKLWVLGLDANTSDVNIVYKPGAFTTNLSYNYGGNISASLGIRRFKGTLSLDPSKGDVSSDLVFQGFNFGTTANYTKRSGGLTLGYGAKLLPFPSELSDTFNSGAHGLQNMASDISAAPNNPLKWYKLHSNDTATIKKAIGTGKDIYTSGQEEDKWGAAVRLNYDPQSKLTIWVGAGVRF